jgi:hypothetical protein
MANTVNTDAASAFDWMVKVETKRVRISSEDRPGRIHQQDVLQLERFRAKWIPVRVKKTRQN